MDFWRFSFYSFLNYSKSIDNKGVIHLVQLVNGGSSFEDTRFQLIYDEQEYFKKPIVVDFLQVNVLDHGPMWMFVIKDIPYEEYITNHSLFALAVGEIHNRIMPFLKEKYDFAVEQCVLADHEASLF